MKFSESWLREWVNPDLSASQLGDQLTKAGLEVDAITPAAGNFSGVVVAEVLGVEQHPNADKLRVCQITVGGDALQVVCGAPNVRAGLKVAFAQVGAELPGDFKIKAAKLRGVDSNGMLCSEQELGLGEGADGILELAEDAPVAEDLRDHLFLDDLCIDIDLTPNRSDCLGITGLAREVGVLNRIAVTPPESVEVAAVNERTFPVALKSPKDCPRYVGRVIEGVDVGASSPLWMKERLRRSGIRSIDPVVDVTNYVMLELGQPMHAFDIDTLEAGIVTRRGIAGEKLVLLDGKEIQLDEDCLIIADHNRPLALAGIMGGEHSGVSAETKNIFLESAYFNPITIAGKAREFGLHTESSHRFERGVDYKLQRIAIERATQLLLDSVGGEAGPVSDHQVEAELPSERKVVLRKSRITQLLAFELADSEIEDILSRLGLMLAHDNTQPGEDKNWVVTVPSYRFDIALEADLLEEIARIYGYERLPETLPPSTSKPSLASETKVTLRDIRRALLARGYNEAITYSFVDPEMQLHFSDENSSIDLANPISSDMSVMRQSIWPGLVQSLLYNLNRQHSRVRLFESGMVFQYQDGQVIQTRKLAGLLSGSRYPESWTDKTSGVDFYDQKGVVEALLNLGDCAQRYTFEAGTHKALHPGQSASILSGETYVGAMGLLHPSIEKKLGLTQSVYLFELDLAAIETGSLANFTELSKFPEVRRDLAILVSEDTPLGELTRCVRNYAGENLVNLTLFDVYQGQGIDPDRKSVALGLTWQHESRTLTDDEIALLIESIVSNLDKEFNAVLRG